MIEKLPNFWFFWNFFIKAPPFVIDPEPSMKFHCFFICVNIILFNNIIIKYYYLFIYYKITIKLSYLKFLKFMQ